MIEELRRGAAQSWRVNRPILLLGLGYILAVEATSRIYGFPHFLDLYHKPLVGISLIAVLVVPFWQVLLHRPDRPITFMVNLLRTRWNLIERAWVIVPPVILLGFMMSSFSSIKSSIQVMNPTLLDPLFLEWDRWLHGGRDAWVLLQPLVGFPSVTKIVEWFYGYWLRIIVGVLVFAIFMTKRTRLRNQFIVAWILTWALPGTVGAIALNSVGPCFYALLFPEGPDPYATLMSYLSDTAPITTQTQEYLWQYHQELGPGFGTGISAMPSMHVAIAALQAVFLWRLSRTAGLLGIVFTAIILIGSVHLGWHYAIDGYVGIAFVPFMWWLGGKIVGSDRRTQDVHPEAPPETDRAVTPLPSHDPSRES